MSGTFTAREISFGPYRLDAANARLLRDGRPIALTPKAFDVLHHLASRPQRLVTKDELLSAVWPDVIVSDASVKVCVREIRKALDDEPKAPTYIETVHRRGYRFVAAVGPEGTDSPATLPVPRPTPAPEAAPATPPTPPAAVAAPAAPAAQGAPALAGMPAPPHHALVGRDPDLRRLYESFQLAQWGRRR
jgi:DNA-binding winged helix-turn-helix (wHTH) protein